MGRWGRVWCARMLDRFGWHNAWAWVGWKCQGCERLVTVPWRGEGWIGCPECGRRFKVAGLRYSVYGEALRRFE